MTKSNLFSKLIKFIYYLYLSLAEKNVRLHATGCGPVKISPLYFTNNKFRRSNVERERDRAFFLRKKFLRVSAGCGERDEKETVRRNTKRSVGGVNIRHNAITQSPGIVPVVQPARQTFASMYPVKYIYNIPNGNRYASRRRFGRVRINLSEVAPPGMYADPFPLNSVARKPTGSWKTQTLNVFV